MDSVDLKQQRAIDKLEREGFWMKLVLAVNFFAAIAQILECWKVWNWGRP